jgi:NitT/TauT family transport system substrate-binding protein
MTSETVPLLISKKIDGCTSAVYHAPVFVEIAGLTPVILSYDDYGMDCYANNILVGEGTVKNNPDLVRAFLKATVKGWEYVFENKKESAGIILKYNPVADPKYITMSLERMLPKVASEDTRKNGLFHQTEEKWAQAQDILFDSGEIDKKLDVKTCYTNDFLPKK